MDFSATWLHYRRMNTRIPPPLIPEYRLYREERDEAADFWLHCEPLPERSRLHRFEIATHRHPAFFQIFLITHGEGEVVDGGTPVRLKSPCAVFVPAGAAHGFRFSQDVDGLVVTALADRLTPPAATDRYVATFAIETRVLPVEDRETDLLRRIAEEQTGHGAGRAAALEALVALAVIGLCRSWLSLRPEIAKRQASGPRAQMLTSLVAAHFREARPAAFYAERMGVSVSQLNRIARAATGQTLQGLLARRITEAACRDLLFTPTTASSIAESLGFTDSAYFNRFFRRQTGMTPGDYRRTERLRLERR